MKYLSEFRDPELARKLFDEIRSMVTRLRALKSGAMDTGTRKA